MCVNIFASSNVIRAALAAGSVVDATEIRKNAKYAVYGRHFIFQPVAVETVAVEHIGLVVRMSVSAYRG